MEDFIVMESVKEEPVDSNEYCWNTFELKPSVAAHKEQKPETTCGDEEKMARFEKHERGILAKICQKYPVLAREAYTSDVIREKKQAWIKICEEFNASNPGKPARECGQLQSLWKRLKDGAKKALDASRNEARGAGGGPSQTKCMDAAEEIVAGMLGASFEPLEMAHDDDAFVFQEGPEVLHIPTIIDNNGGTVNGSWELDVMETNDAPGSSAKFSMPVAQKKASKVKKKNNNEDELLKMAKLEHMAKMEQHAVKLRTLKIKKKTALLELKKQNRYNIKSNKKH
ncbi:Uncharacterized protein GBIM_08592 [Gryllus bimaculatus]|nr:Uncharacterized protein GBIM_08592 [Gryllus bimaculatus]